MAEKRFYAQYQLRNVADPTDGKQLPVSYAPVHGPQHYYVTVPWNVQAVGPNDPLNQVSLSNGWSFLYGPTLPGAIVTAHLRLWNAEPECSNHLCLYKVAAGSEAHVWASESPEHEVLAKETGNTHLDAAWQVPALATGERLRLQADYWNARDPDKLVCYMVGATVEINYWRETS